MNQYEVLCVEGDTIVVNGVDCQKGDILEMTAEEAAEALAASKVKLVEVAAPEEATIAVPAPLEDAANEIVGNTVGVDPALEGAEKTVETVVEGGEVAGAPVEVIPPAEGTGVGASAASQEGVPPQDEMASTQGTAEQALAPEAGAQQAAA